jgi:hypothetical protein
MLNLAQAASIVCVISLVFALDGGVAEAGLSTNCVAADGSAASLLVQVGDKKSKKKKHQESSGLAECTIQSPGSGGGCKSGFKWTCEKMKSGNKCCGCVADKNAKQAPAQAGQGGVNNENVLWGDYFQTDPQQAPAQGNQGPGTDAAKDWVDTQNKADGRFGVGYDAVTPDQ